MQSLQDRNVVSEFVCTLATMENDDVAFAIGHIDIHLPPSCPHSDIQTFRLCNAMTRGKFALCNNPIACSRPRNSVAPDRFIENCVRDVCQSPPSERERSACVAYTAYAVACRESCHLQLDLTMFPGCGQ